MESGQLCLEKSENSSEVIKKGSEYPSLIKQFLTPEEKKQLRKLPVLTDEEKLLFEVLADSLIDAAFESINAK